MTHQQLSDLPQTWLEFGHGLAKLRAASQLGQRNVAAASGGVISKSSLQRYEQGKPLTTDKARTLDSIYRSDGWVTAAVAGLEAINWVWRPGTADTFFVHEWPASFNGWVWIAILPEPKNAGQLHALSLRWGPWHRQLREPVPGRGLALRTGKARDEHGRSAQCQLSSDQRISALFGVHMPPPEMQVIDIRDGWT